MGENGRLVDSDEIKGIIDQLGGFGTDNRAGLERQLHRISAVRNREDTIIGLTMRVGRHVSGNATMISDLLFAHSQSSILFLGEPGSGKTKYIIVGLLRFALIHTSINLSHAHACFPFKYPILLFGPRTGKTTVVREVTRLLAERSNVLIVDTSNEIGGDGDIVHPCVGAARRMMVKTLGQQSAVMIECVQNHTPHVMIIDEIGRSTEVVAAQTCKNRGVRLIASAHGNFRSLTRNANLRGLIGGVQNVTIGDEQAKEEAQRHHSKTISKTKAERAGSHIFEIIVELSRGEHHSWRIVTSTAEALDLVLDGQDYLAQQRTRDPSTGAIQIEFISNRDVPEDTPAN